MTIEPLGTISGVPATFHWIRRPAAFEFDGSSLSVSAGPGTDWFIDPGSGEAQMNAPALVCAPDGDFTFSAHAEVPFASTFDAGALVLWQDERTWAKLALELSPQGEPTVVAVVTRGESDDCISMVVRSHAAWLRIARIGSAHAFHASMDGDRWQFVRHFRLGTKMPEIGFEAQSPCGPGCTPRFSHIVHTSGTLADLRSGV
jgi:hypothetical protein